MKKIITKLLSLMLVFVMTGSMAQIAFAEVGGTITKGAAPTILAVGDSITTGYGLRGYTTDPLPYAKSSFVTKLSTKLKQPIANLAVDGLRSVDVRKAMASADVQQLLKGADTVLLTIGGNDLLNVLFVRLAKTFAIDPTSPTLPQEVTAKMQAVFTSGDLQAMALVQTALKALEKDVKVAAKSYARNLNVIIAKMKKANPKVKIIMQTIYNPYAPVPVIASAMDAGVTAFNKIIVAGSRKNTVYTVVDTYTAFATAMSQMKKVTNVDVAKMNLDPHPNVLGHNIITNLIYKAMSAK